MSLIRHHPGNVTKLGAKHRTRLAQLKRENATRIPCAICGVRVLPGAMAAHLSIHEDDAA